MLKFAYGLSDFAKIIDNDYLYVDRTDRIPLLENAGEQLLFLRPRRFFGKSLLLSMLENYYDRADENLAMDRNRLRHLSQLPAGRALIEQVVADSQPLFINRRSSRFRLMALLNPSPDQATLASLMYYLGILTLAGRGELNELQLRIPNLVIRQLYVERLYEMCWPAETESLSPATAAKVFYT